MFGQPVTFTVQASKTDQDVFKTIANLITALKTPTSGSVGAAKLTNGLNTALSNLDLAQDRLLTVRSAVGATMMALLPPSSSSRRPKRCATRGASARPMRVLPVAEVHPTAISYGMAMMGSAQASGENRARIAADIAIILGMCPRR